MFSWKAHTYHAYLDTRKLKKRESPITLEKKACLKNKFMSGTKRGLFWSFLPDSFITAKINAASQTFKV